MIHQKDAGQIGKTISHYKILEKLGEGGMGVVYKAEDLKLKRTVALKFLPPELTRDPEAKERFIQEAQAASALDHPNICVIHEIDETEDGQMFICMAYYDGETLKKKIASGQSREAGSRSAGLPVDSVIDIAIQIAQGLVKAHEHGIVHRDIKPGNIMITKDGMVKILDFGLAKLAGQVGLTKTGRTMGTIAYMSPEQARGEEVDHRTDIWSLGIVFYEMVTGKLPFRGEYEQAVIYSIMNEEPEPIMSLRPGLPMELERIMNKALKKNPDERYTNVEDLLLDLKMEKKSYSVIKSNVVKSTRSKLRPTKIRLLAFILVSLIILLIFLYLIHKPTSKLILPTHKKLTFTGDVNFPAISPDGEYFAYVTGQTFSNQKVMVQDLDGRNSLEIFNANFCLHPKWSPDGTKLSLKAEIDSTHATFIVPRLGGNARQVWVSDYTSWSPDGSQIALTWGRANLLWFLNYMTGDTTLVHLNGSFDLINALDWSPTGNLILFSTQSQHRNTIWTIKPDGTDQHKIIEDSLQIFSPRWSQKGDAIYYLRENEQTKDLMKIKVTIATGKPESPPEILQTGLQSGSYFTLTKDNKKLLYTRELQYANLYLINIEREDEAQTHTSQPKMLTTGTSWIAKPRISPNCKRVAFSIGKYPHKTNIYVIPIEGGKMQQLTFFNSYNSCPAWSPDGREIAFGSTQGRKANIWIINSTGGTPRPYKHTELGEVPFDLAWAPTPNILYHRTGRQNFHILNPETYEQRTLVTSDSSGWMYSPRYSPDSKRVAVYWNRWDKVGKRMHGIWILSLQDSSQKILYKGDINPIEWSADGKWIYAWNFFQKPTEILKIPLSGGQSESIAKLSLENIFEITMTPDGKRIVCQVVKTQSDVWVMENFDPEVK